MAQSSRFGRRVQAARARKSRTLLLPLPRAAADELSLRYHVALEAMRTGHGGAGAAHTLIALLLLTRFLSEAGYDALSDDAVVAGEEAITAAIDTANRTGTWAFDTPAYQAVAAVLLVHDAQLGRAPLSAIVAASERLDRFPVLGAPPPIQKV
jgi:hypothetical protein